MEKPGNCRVCIAPFTVGADTEGGTGWGGIVGVSML